MAILVDVQIGDAGVAVIAQPAPRLRFADLAPAGGALLAGSDEVRCSHSALAEARRARVDPRVASRRRVGRDHRRPRSHKGVGLRRAGLRSHDPRSSQNHHRGKYRFSHMRKTPGMSRRSALPDYEGQPCRVA